MRKKIIWIGNSAGFVIDRSLRNLLGLRVGTFVDIETDGRTLILQRSKVQDEETGSTTTNENAVAIDRDPGSVTDVELKRLVMQASSVSDTVLHHSVPFEVVRDLFHGPMPDPRNNGSSAWVASLSPYMSWAREIHHRERTPADIATLRRFDALVAHYMQDWLGGCWKESAKVALAQVPMLREPGYVEPVRSTECVESARPASTPRPSLLDQLLGGDHEDFDDEYGQSLSS